MRIHDNAGRQQLHKLITVECLFWIHIIYFCVFCRGSVLCSFVIPTGKDGRLPCNLKFGANIGWRRDRLKLVEQRQRQ